MAIANGDILRVAMRWQNDSGNDFVNVWHVQVTDRGSQSEDAFLDDLMMAIWAPYTHINTHMPNDYLVQDFKIDRVAWQSGKEVILETFGVRQPPTGLGGAAAEGNELPWYVAPLLKFRTGAVKSVAKKFLFGFREDAQEDGRLGSGVLADLATMAAAYLAPLVLTNGGTVRAVIYARRAAAWKPFIAAIADNVLAVQRRRKQGVGE